MTPEYIFTVLYILLSICIIYPPIEFIAAGFTVASVFGSFLGSEDEEFVRFHLRRSSLTLFVYTLLPLGYVMGLVSFAFDENVSDATNQKLAEIYVSDVNGDFRCHFLLCWKNDYFGSYF